MNLFPRRRRKTVGWHVRTTTTAAKAPPRHRAEKGRGREPSLNCKKTPPTGAQIFGLFLEQCPGKGEKASTQLDLPPFPLFPSRLHPSSRQTPDRIKEAPCFPPFYFHPRPFITSGDGGARTEGSGEGKVQEKTLFFFAEY